MRLEQQVYSKTEVCRLLSGATSLVAPDQEAAAESAQSTRTGANRHDQWTADDLIISLVVRRPNPVQVEHHLCMDRGYGYADVHQFVAQERYIAHIKHRRCRGDPLLEPCPVPGETQFPARRWVVERTLGWLVKRRSLRVRWCKKVENWLALVQFACAHILMDPAIYG